MAKYCYPAIMTPEEVGYSVEFPDLENCFTCGETLEEAMEMAQDALEMMLGDAEDKGEVIPPASDLRKVEATEGALVTLVVADTQEWRKRTSARAVKKTLTIPQWLNTAAEERGVNFSQVLQDALKKELQLA